MEAPGLLMKGGKALSDFDPSIFMARAVLLDLYHEKPNQTIDDEDLEAAEEAAGLAIRENDIVLIQTVVNPKRAGREAYPTLSLNAVEFLEFRHIAGVGVGTPSVDSPDSGYGDVHKALFERGIFVIENLHGLDRVDESIFQIIALPLKVRGAVSPSRVVGILEQGI
jgi:kynurenine formamidase